MKNNLIKLSCFFLFLCASLSHARTGGDTGGNGGAGIRKDSKYMTFYSAGLYVEPVGQSDVPYSPPQLDNFLAYVRNFKYWSNDDKAKLIKVAVPSSSHTYFKVKEDQFDQTTLDRILSEFRRVINQPVDGLELFAITDIEKGQTFLLPNFYKLQPSDQMAILFHENYWILSGKGTDYKDVVGAELAFQAVYEQPNNGPRIMDLLSRYGDQSKIHEVLAKIDLDSGVLKNMLTDGKLPLRVLLGEDLSNCAPNCVRGVLSYNLLKAVQAYPGSVILRRLLNDVQKRRGLRVDFKYSELSMRLGTSMGWIFFPNRSTDNGSMNVEDRLTDGVKYDRRNINFASCWLDLNPEKVGKLYCSDMDASIHSDSLTLEF